MFSEKLAYLPWNFDSISQWPLKSPRSQIRTLDLCIRSLDTFPCPRKIKMPVNSKTNTLHICKSICKTCQKCNAVSCIRTILSLAAEGRRLCPPSSPDDSRRFTCDAHGKATCLGQYTPWPAAPTYLLAADCRTLILCGSQKAFPSNLRTQKFHQIKKSALL